MNKLNFSRRRTFVALTGFALWVIVSQGACVPTDDQATSDFLSGLASDAMNQAINFVVSFARSALAAFLL